MGENGSKEERRTVLIVDDDESIREVMSMMLEIENFEIILAENGKDALTKLAEAPILPCLILLDLMMPVMNGWQFVEEKEKVDAFAAIPVVVVTAFRDKADSIKADDIVLKPIEYEGLLKTVRKYCG